MSNFNIKSMGKIILSEKEIEVIKKQLSGKIEVHSATEEEQKFLMDVIDKAEALEEELDAYDESGDDLIEWFYNKYKEQESMG